MAHEEKARIFDEQHPHIWVEIKRIAKRAKAKGFQTWSMSGIFEVLRWETKVDLFEDYKVNNNYRKYYTLKLLEIEEFKGFIKTRSK